VLLLDTYDTVRAARMVVASGLRPSAVRIDSGDIVALSREVRHILDAGGLHDTKIFASSDLDEWRIAEILGARAPVDAFGVGASITTSSDAPSMGAVYKLVEIARGGERIPIMKLSPGKHTFPGRKQVWRTVADGQAAGDVMALADEPGPAGAQPLLERVMVDGRRERAPEPADRVRARCLDQIARLPAAVRRLRDAQKYPVRASDALQRLIDRVSQASITR